MRVTGQTRRVLREAAAQASILACAVLLIVTTGAVITTIAGKGTAIFRGEQGSAGVRLSDVLMGFQWDPQQATREGGPALGIVPFVAGTVMVSLLALAIAVPTGISCAIVVSDLAPGWAQGILEHAAKVLSGIPSVVYGWVGLSTVVPFVRGHFGGLGFSVLAGGIVLSIMVLPTIVSISTDAMKDVPNGLREAAYSLGTTRWQVIRRVVIPSSSAGILTAVVLAMSRACGEALAVQMVIGNVKQVPSSLLSPAATLTTGIAMDMGNTVAGSLWNDALWTMALVLLVMSMSFTALVRLFSSFAAKGGPSA